MRSHLSFPGLSGAMAGISVRSSTPGSPTHVSGSSNAGRRRNGLHDVDLNTFISEEMALHLGSAGTRKRSSVQCADVITDSPTHKRNRMLWVQLLFCMLCAAWNKSHLILNICVPSKGDKERSTLAYSVQYAVRWRLVHTPPCMLTCFFLRLPQNESHKSSDRVIVLSCMMLSVSSLLEIY